MEQLNILFAIWISNIIQRCLLVYFVFIWRYKELKCYLKILI